MATKIRSKETTRKFRHKVDLRMKIGFPLIVMLTVIVSSLMVFLLTQSIYIDKILQVQQHFRFEKGIGPRIYLTIFGLGVFGLIVGLILSIHVTTLLRQITNRVESASFLMKGKKSLDKTKSPPEDAFGELGAALERMVGSLGSLTLDSYILDSVSGGIITISQESIITSSNPRAEAILGFNTDEITGEPLDKAFPSHPSNSQLRKVLADCIKNGTIISSLEMTVLTNNQQEVLIGTSVSPLNDAKGQSLGIVLTFKDLKAVKQVKDQIQLTDQLATLGSFAAGMAHEIRNPLASLQGMVELLIEDVPPEDSKRPYLNTIQRNLTRLTSLTENLLNLAHPGETQLEPTGINQIVSDSVQLVRHENPRKLIKIKEEYESALPNIYTDREKLERAFLNIILNAYQATPEGGEIEILTSSLTKEESPLAGGRPAISVAVSNTGTYIPKEKRAKLFIPFYTTKDRGVGLGLAITHQIVSAHSGLLTVESDPDKGTCFKVFLPSEKTNKEDI